MLPPTKLKVNSTHFSEPARNWVLHRAFTEFLSKLKPCREGSWTSSTPTWLHPLAKEIVDAKVNVEICGQARAVAPLVATKSLTASRSKGNAKLWSRSVAAVAFAFPSFDSYQERMRRWRSGRLEVNKEAKRRSSWKSNTTMYHNKINQREWQLTSIWPFYEVFGPNHHPVATCIKEGK